MAEKCSVCGISAKPTKPIHLHYGSLSPSCLNCKLFFKRCHQECMDETGLKYKCIEGNPGKCLVSHELSKKLSCKECKFLKCFAVGMNPTAILGAKEKEKFAKKSLPKGTETQPDPKPESQNPTQPETRNSSTRAPSTSHNSPGDIMNQVIMASDISKKSLPLEKYTEMLLAFAYLHETNWSARHTDSFLEAFQNQCLQLVQTVGKLDVWQGICQEDQDILRRHNLDLFKHYLIARYFISNDGFSQLNWILGPQTEKFYGNVFKNK